MSEEEYLEKYYQKVYEKYCELHPEEITSDFILEEDGNEDYIEEIIKIILEEKENKWLYQRQLMSI